MDNPLVPQPNHSNDLSSAEKPKCCKVDDCVTRTSTIFFMVWLGTIFSFGAFVSPYWARGTQPFSADTNQGNSIYIGLWGSCYPTTSNSDDTSYYACSTFGSTTNPVANSQMCDAITNNNNNNITVNASSSKGKFTLAFCPTNGQVVTVAIFAALQVTWGLIAVVIAAILS